MTERVLTFPDEFAQRTQLLATQHLRPPDGGESVGIFNGDNGCDDTLIAVGSLCGNIIQGVAVAPEYEGEGLMARIVTLLLTRGLATQNNIRVFTKVSTAPLFRNLGFTQILHTGAVALLEWRNAFAPYLEQLRITASPIPAAAVVMNANPFTRGHRHVIEQACAAFERVFVLVVEEERSAFPFSIRYALVKHGVADLAGVTVLPGGEYVISSATFPSYFTKETELVRAHAGLDLGLFGKHIAPALNVTARFVGSEPLCPATAAYNALMHELLPPLDVRVVEIPRLQSGAEAVSASRVRRALAQSREHPACFKAALDLLPEPTRRWLESPEAHDVLERLQNRVDETPRL